MKRWKTNPLAYFHWKIKYAVLQERALSFKVANIGFPNICTNRQVPIRGTVCLFYWPNTVRLVCLPMSVRSPKLLGCLSSNGTRQSKAKVIWGAILHRPPFLKTLSCKIMVFYYTVIKLTDRVIWQQIFIYCVFFNDTHLRVSQIYGHLIFTINQWKKTIMYMSQLRYGL